MAAQAGGDGGQDGGDEWEGRRGGRRDRENGARGMVGGDGVLAGVAGDGTEAVEVCKGAAPYGSSDVLADDRQMINVKHTCMCTTLTTIQFYYYYYYYLILNKINLLYFFGFKR